jgi:hypothetical protein
MWNPAVPRSDPGCRLCALAPDSLAPGLRALSTRIVAHLEPEVVVFVGPAARDLLVAPRRHLESLSATAAVLGDVLAAIRRVVNVLRSVLGTVGATVEPTLEVGGSAHISFRVVPTDPSAQVGALGPDVGTMVALIAGAFVPARPSVPR